ncbi:DUF4402 domain-containing protein [Candidatus Woesearchaeota archaeon]|jgi:hypothetical protein|nr:DUF4402 domain-containing protein [Candidatus Woesearchaeota archaeon]MBT4248638.1 DUF4402 domain-containing protein [Candidatus Woesearchaeota archaeon]
MQSKYDMLRKKRLQERIALLERYREHLYLEIRKEHNVIEEGNRSQEQIKKYDVLVMQFKKVQFKIGSFKRALSQLDSEHHDLAHAQAGRNSKVAGVVLSILFIALGMLFTQPGFVEITGFATSAQVSAVSNVTITQNVAIQANNLSVIQFGNLVPGTDGNNATTNYNATDNSSAYIEMGPNTSVDVDLCINATLLVSGVNNISRDNYTFTNGSTQDPPNYTDAISLNETFYKYAEAISRSNRSYHRFWLDIPPQQAAGTYNNTVTFKAVATTLSC